MFTLNGNIRRILKANFVDYAGFADLSSYQHDLVRYGGDIVAGYTAGISIGIGIPDAIVDHLPRRDDTNVSCEYRIHGYEVLNDRLNILASMLASYLNAKGWRTLPIAVADRTDEDNAVPTVSHKMIAHIAGLGWIGKSCLLVTPDRGPRVRFISVLTEAPVKSVDRPLDSACGSCVACVKACPVGAFTGREYVVGEAREMRFDFRKCHDYFEQMKKTRPYAVCGMCLYACPRGMRS